MDISSIIKRRYFSKKHKLRSLSGITDKYLDAVASIYIHIDVHISIILLIVLIVNSF